jgi:hypothetical protein
MDAVYEERQLEFGREYEDFEPSEIVQLCIKTGEWLDVLLMDPDVVQEVMILLHRRVIGTGDPGADGAGWRQVWEDTDLNDTMQPKASQFMVGMNAFAFHGLLPDIPHALREKFGDGGREIVEGCVAMGRALLEAIPPAWGEVPEIRRTILAAEARLWIDTGRDVSPEHLAALARISLKSIKNLLTRSGGDDLMLNADGKIDAADAARWLASRSDFKSSMWRNAPGSESRFSPPDDTDLGEVLFVPVAADGTWFDPVVCRRRNGYAIGPKGSEETVADYRDALQRLARMPTPYWRRPNQSGNWGLISGQTWVRKVASDLRLDSADPAREA